MIGVDTNILVYAHRQDSEWHEAARDCLGRLWASDEPWGIAWPVVHEFLAVVTHPRIYRPPSTMTEALDQVQVWRQSPSLRLLAEPADYWDWLEPALRAGDIRGPRVHDARIAAIYAAHGAELLWTADRNLQPVGGLRAENPLTAP